MKGKIKILLLSFIFIAIFTKCKNSSPSNEKIEVAKTYKYANDEFRDKIISKITDLNDAKLLDSLCTKLDKKNIKFCDFVKELYEIDDASYAIAKEKFPRASQNKQFIELHNKSLDFKQNKYLKEVDISEHLADFATTVYAFNEDVKNYCGVY